MDIGGKVLGGDDDYIFSNLYPATHSQREFLPIFYVPELMRVPHRCIFDMGSDQECIQLYQGITARELVIACTCRAGLLFFLLCYNMW